MRQLVACFLFGLSCVFTQTVFAQDTDDDAAPYTDIFTGTILLEGEQVKLVRCDAVSNTYILQNAKGSEEDFLDILRKIAATGKKFYISLSASYKEIDDQNGLLVSGMSETSSGSCHLEDVFRDPTN